ncbi:MAG UNVERIFIED_CONTAM: hypothetical protein LVR29_14635 [Microcystis novacekii LVE1205-3]
MPITVTSKGLEYGEVVGEGEVLNAYSQPISLDRESLKSLHRLGMRQFWVIDVTACWHPAS